MSIKIETQLIHLQNMYVGQTEKLLKSEADLAKAKKEISSLKRKVKKLEKEKAAALSSKIEEDVLNLKD